MLGRAVTARTRVAVQKRDTRVMAMATQRKGAAKPSAANAGRTLWLPNTVRRTRPRLLLRLRLGPGLRLQLRLRLRLRCGGGRCTRSGPG